MGSNIFNVLGIIGASAAAEPLSVANTIYPSYYFMMGLTPLMFILKRRTYIIGRAADMALLTIYGFYLFILYLAGGPLMPTL